MRHSQAVQDVIEIAAWLRGENGTIQHGRYPRYHRAGHTDLSGVESRSCVSYGAGDREDEESIGDIPQREVER